MAFPTPTIYTYRIKHIAPYGGLATSHELGYWEAQFSTDSGTTYTALFSQPFGSYLDAMNAVATLVNAESSFRTSRTVPLPFGSMGVQPVVTYFAYPPA